MQALPKCINDLLETFISNIKYTIKECFAGIETKKTSERKSKSGSNIEQSKPKPSPGKPQGTTASQQFSRKFWSALENLFEEEIFNCWKQINFLTKCLKKVIYQPNAVNRFESIDIEKHFHDQLNAVLRASFIDCPAHIRQCLVQDLPKLLRLTKHLNSKCENRLNIGYADHLLIYIFNQEFPTNFKSFNSSHISGESLFASLEAGYLEQCANNLKVYLVAAETANQVRTPLSFKFCEIELTGFAMLRCYVLGHNQRFSAGG